MNLLKTLFEFYKLVGIVWLTFSIGAVAYSKLIEQVDPLDTDGMISISPGSCYAMTQDLKTNQVTAEEIECPKD